MAEQECKTMNCPGSVHWDPAEVFNGQVLYCTGRAAQVCHSAYEWVAEQEDWKLRPDLSTDREWISDDE